LTESFCRENSIEKWLGDNNSVMYNDICQVYESGKSLFSSEYELKVPKLNRTIHYHITPFAGTTKGVVLVLDDISAEKRAVTTLQRYMSPALAKQVMEESTGELGGTRKKVSILFSDIRSFTTLSEGMEPTDVVELLNHHFTDAVNAITEEQGILDKFIGDAVMAVFGVPFISQEDATHACNTALKMREALIVTNKFRESSGKLGIKIGIGVNTGMVLSGNIGSKARMEFSCIGDAVNLASRIEGLTKFYGVQILISEFTLADTGDAFLVRELDSVVVSGKKNAVRVYELLGKKGDILAREVREVSSLYTNALGFYRARNFSQAMDLFQSCIKLHFDGPSKVLLERCKKYIYAPPPQDWDGCFISTEK
jgi:class 3 adenylate cyclase